MIRAVLLTSSRHEVVPTRCADATVSRYDRGVTFLELLIVVVILGVLAVFAAVATRTVGNQAHKSACRSDRYHLSMAVEAYSIRHHTSVVPDAGGPEGYEQTLVDEGLLRTTSERFDLDPDGHLVLAAGSPCSG